jgi:glycerate dehydrogenase
MKMIVLDGYTLNPGDLSWDALRERGELVVYDRTQPDEIAERAKDADIIFTNKVQLTSETLHRLPALKYIGVLATGYNIVDTEAAKQLHIIVSNVPGYSTASVAQLCFALILELTHHVQRHSDAVHHGKWTRSPDFCFWDYPLIELAGKTIGIIGFGTIGALVSDLATAFGMNTIAHSRTRSDQDNRRNFRWVTRDELFKQADIVSLHCPLTSDTTGIINADTIQSMKRSAFIINTSRGGLVVEKDLAAALNSGRLAGAGLDVLSVEPPMAHNPLLHAKNCLITPHIAWASFEARQRLLDTAASNAVAFMNGNPVNIVNG